MGVAILSIWIGIPVIQFKGIFGMDGQSQAPMDGFTATLNWSTGMLSRQNQKFHFMSKH